MNRSLPSVAIACDLEGARDDTILISLQVQRVYTQMAKLLIETKRPELALRYFQLALTSFYEVNAAHFSSSLHLSVLTSSSILESSRNIPHMEIFGLVSGLLITLRKPSEAVSYCYKVNLAASFTV